MFDLDAALAEFARWGTGSHEAEGVPPAFIVYRQADTRWQPKSTHGTYLEAEATMNRDRLEASIKAALGQSQEAAA